MKQEFDSLTAGLWDLNVGQIYSTLERMLKDGLVLLEEADGPGEDRKVYRVTEAGLRELDTWLQRPPLKPKPMRDEVFVRLGLLIERDPEAALALLESQRRVGHLQLAELTRQKISLTRLGGRDRLRRELMLDAALLHAEADIKWLDLCETKLRRLITGDVTQGG